MRYAMLLLLCLLASCPAGPARTGAAAPGAGGVQARPAQQTAGWPQPALDYIAACLDKPSAAGNAALGPVCQVLAQFPELAGDTALAQLKQGVLQWRGRMGESVASELASAWLAAEPQLAGDFIAARAKAGDDNVLKALRYDPAAGRKVLYALDAAKLTNGQLNRVMELLRIWGGAVPADKPLLEALAKCDPRIGYRALGYLLRLEPDNAKYLEQLDLALRNAKPEQLAAAVEGAKISGHGGLAAALVPLVAQAKLGDELVQPQAAAAAATAEDQAAAPAAAQDKAAKPASKESLRVVLGAYALAYLPGEQAQFARRKLLGAEDPLVRWQARLGELLHGDEQPWRDAVARQGVEQAPMWVALEPPEAFAPALLKDYAKAAAAEDAITRGRVALHLNRYEASKSDKQVLAALSLLCKAPEVEVREAAWYTLGKLRLDPQGADPLTAAGDASALPAERLAAAYCALRLAQHPVE